MIETRRSLGIPVARADPRGGDVPAEFLQGVRDLLGLVARPLQEEEHLIHAGRKIAIDEPYDVGGCVSYGADGADERLFPLDVVLPQLRTHAAQPELCSFSNVPARRIMWRNVSDERMARRSPGPRPTDAVRWTHGTSDFPIGRMDPDPNTQSVRSDFGPEVTILAFMGARASTSLRSPITALDPGPLPADPTRPVRESVAVAGSCLTRDNFNGRFNPEWRTYFEVVASANQSSIISLMSRNPLTP